MVKKAAKKAPKRSPATVTHTREDGTTSVLKMPPARRGTFKRQRPRGEEPFDALLKVKMPAAELEAARRLAAHMSKTPSAMVRELIARELSRSFPRGTLSVAELAMTSKRAPKAPKVST